MLNNKCFGGLLFIISCVIFSAGLHAETFFENQWGRDIVYIEYLGAHDKDYMKTLRKQYDLLVKISESKNGLELLVSSLNYHMAEGIYRERDELIILFGDFAAKELERMIGVPFECDLVKPWKCVDMGERDTHAKYLINIINADGKRTKTGSETELSLQNSDQKQ